MAAFWMEVGDLRCREWVRWVERKGERPREVKGEVVAGRGALDGEGAGGFSVGCAGVGGAGFEVGLEVKREETTSLGLEGMLWVVGGG